MIATRGREVEDSLRGFHGTGVDIEDDLKEELGTKGAAP